MSVGCGPGSAPTTQRDDRPEPVTTRPLVPSANAVVGSFGCSARGCHGAVEPTPTPGHVLHAEYVAWLDTDPHARAFESLTGDLADAIVKRLGGSSARRDTRCLACHAAPATAGRQPTPALEAERLASGVGCEACHGPASNWIEPHARPDVWSGRSADDKRRLGFRPLADESTRIDTCVGCHVGAPPSADSPELRDVNHDLIAAGHPRLYFEYAAYFANLPRHWEEPHTPSRPAVPESRRWLAGQFRTAAASLDLLNHRATGGAGPWPEFADLDCFACHHDLSGATPDPPGRGRRPGSLRPQSWYTAVPRLLAAAGGTPDDLAVLTALDGLDVSRITGADRLTRTPRVVKEAQVRLEDQYRRLERRLDGERSPTGLRTALYDYSRQPGAGDGRVRFDWDTEAQLELALVAMNQEQPDAGVATFCRALAERLRFRTPDGGGPDRYHSPHGYRPRQGPD